jgi:hypothetical protein
MSHICCTVPVVLAHGSTRRTCPGSLSLARSLVSPFHIPANLRVTCGLTLWCPARGLTRFLSPIQARSGLEQRQWSIFSHRSCEGTTDIRDICDTAACDPIEAPCRSILDPNLVHPAKQPSTSRQIRSMTISRSAACCTSQDQTSIRLHTLVLALALVLVLRTLSYYGMS